MMIDLSHTIVDHMPTHPYDNVCSVQQIRFLEKNYYNDCQLTCGMHVGTHIDGPAHLLEKKKFLCDCSVARFVAPGILIDARGREIIDIDVLQKYVFPSGAIVLFLTGHDARWGKDDYFTKHPTITLACAQKLIDVRVNTVGFDMPSPDLFPFDVHTYFLSHDVLIIENLTNLVALIGVSRFTLIALPIKIAADSALARVVALVE